MLFFTIIFSWLVRGVFYNCFIAVLLTAYRSLTLSFRFRFLTRSSRLWRFRLNPPSAALLLQRPILQVPPLGPAVLVSCPDAAQPIGLTHTPVIRREKKRLHAVCRVNSPPPTALIGSPGEGVWIFKEMRVLIGCMSCSLTITRPLYIVQYATTTRSL